MGGAGRGQHHRLKAGRREFAGIPAGRLTVERDRRQARREAVQARKPVGLLVTDCCISAAFAVACVQYIPNAKPVRKHAL